MSSLNGLRKDVEGSLDVENKTSKVETCIIDFLIKVAENRQFGMPNS